jgi:exonuclease SbcC
MLIRSLKLINFKKYTNLLIDDFPEKGVIKVGGKNEAGKTSIGDAVCFALFGRTFLNNKKSAKRLIRWNEKEMTVSLVLFNEDESFEITRTINTNSLGSIRIVRLSDNHTLTDSLKGSDKIISDLLGYNYDTFIDSFCIVQHELTTPEADGKILRQMAGISDYANIVNELALEKEEEKVSLAALKPHYAEKREVLEEIELDESWLPELIDGKESLLANRADKQQLIGQLEEVNTIYADTHQQYKKASKGNNLFEWLGVFLLPLMIGAWIVWGAFQFFPNIIQSWLPDTTTGEHAGSFIAWVQTWMFFFAMACVLLYSISLVFKWFMEAKLNALSEQGEEVSNMLTQGYQEVISEPNSIVPTRVANILLDRNNQLNTNEVPTLTLSPVEKFNQIPRLAESVLNYSATPGEVSDSIDSLRDTLHTQGQEIDQCLLGLDSDINVEKKRADRAGRLRAGLQKISQLMRRHEENIKVREYSIKMMKRAASKSMGNFNQSITEFAQNVLPHFTAGRYSQLKINEDLSVEVFSDEKQSYMEYDEISSGTQRQIMLALRMGMSEQLAKNTGNKKQFIFLDEPFAFFDNQRTVTTLKALPNVSDTITQIWVTSQEFPQDVTVV